MPRGRPRKDNAAPADQPAKPAKGNAAPLGIEAQLFLSKAFALASASDEARAIRDEVGFFQAIRVALTKSAPGDGKKSTAEREFAIQQLVSPPSCPPKFWTS